MASTHSHSWNDISISQFYKIKNHIALEDPTDNLIALYNAIYDVDIALESITSMLKALNSLSFLNEEIPKVKLNKNSTIKVNDVEFAILYNILDLPAADFLDLDHYLKQADNIHFILSYVLKPIESKTKSFFGKETYTFAAVERSEIQEHLLYYLDIATANAILSFFLKIWKRLINSYKVDIMIQQNKILRMMIVAKLKKKEDKLEILGIGLNGLTQLQKQLDDLGKMFTE